MDRFSAALPATLGLLALCMAYTFSRKWSPAFDDERPPIEATEFSASAVVQPHIATVFEYTPPISRPGKDHAAGISRVFNNLQLESGSFVRPNPTGPGADEDAVGDPINTGTADEAPVAGSLSNPRLSATPVSSSRPVTPGPSSMLGRSATPGLSSILHNHSDRPKRFPMTRSGSSRAASAPPSSATCFGIAPSTASTPANTPRSQSRASTRRAMVISRCSSRSESVAGSSKPASTRAPASGSRINAKFVNVLPDGTRPKTAYFKSTGEQHLAHPPHRTLSKMGLEVGDIYMHISPNDRQYWLFKGGAGEEARWESIDLGYCRPEDGQFLSLTASGAPSFVGDNWAHRHINREKGKGVTTEDSGEDEEDQDEGRDVESEDE
ncbi:hypothetical protein C8T65DRAFT_741979 [Cerioporus squamosus]|nr:hypothetical protein C8T65DRAFT_741979 [Cerioporus squamosus]